MDIQSIYNLYHRYIKGADIINLCKEVNVSKDELYRNWSGLGLATGLTLTDKLTLPVNKKIIDNCINDFSRVEILKKEFPEVDPYQILQVMKQVYGEEYVGDVTQLTDDKIELLPHNQMLYDKIVKEIENGERSIFYSQATGLGKSFIFMRLVQDYFMDKKILYIVPKIAIWSNLINYPDFNKLNKDNIEMTTYTYFNNYDESLTNKYDVIFVDECHHMLSDIQGNNIKILCNKMRDLGKYAFGLTATPYYQGKYVDEECFDVSCFGYDIFEAIEQGLLPKIKLALANIDLDTVPEYLKVKYSIMGTKSLLNKILSEHSEITKWLAYFTNKQSLEESVYEMQQLFPEYEILKIYEGCGNEAEIFHKFEYANNKVILMSVNKLLEGVHLKDVQGVLLYRNVVQFSTYMQMYGRLCNINSSITPVFVDVTNAIISISKFSEFKSPRYIGERKNINKRDLFDINASDYWTIELSEMLHELSLIKPWTKDEDNILELYYRKIPIDQLCNMLPNRTSKAITGRACILGVTGNKPWTEEEDTILRNNTELTSRELEQLLLNRNWQAIKRRRRILGLTKERSPLWTEEEKAILISCSGLHIEEMQKLLPNKTLGGIESMCKKLHVSRKTQYTDKRLEWSEEELKILVDNYSTMGSSCFDLIPGKTKSQCANKVFKLHLKKDTVYTDDFIEYLRNNYSEKGPRFIAKKFGLGHNQVQHYADRLGLTKSMEPCPDWTEHMDKYLTDNILSMRREDIANYLNVTVSQVGHRITKLGLQHRSVRFWDNEEIEKLKELHNDGMTVNEISRVMGRAQSSVLYKLKILGLR